VSGVGAVLARIFTEGANVQQQSNQLSISAESNPQYCRLQHNYIGQSSGNSNCKHERQLGHFQGLVVLLGWFHFLLHFAGGGLPFRVEGGHS